MQRSIALGLIGLVALALALLVGGVLTALHYAGPADAQLRAPVMLYALGASLVLVLAALVFWRFTRQRLLTPLGSLARDVRALLQVKQLDRSLRVPDGHGLGDLPESIAKLVDELRGARREAVRAMATATARMEQEKSWLEVILLELVREGVVVCNQAHRILLYNQPAARLFSYSHALGLSRSFFDLVASEPVKHALERLEFRLQNGSRDLSVSFVCATPDARSMLKGRMALILDQDRKSNGYVVTLEDISAELADLQRHESVRRMVTRGLRGPLASLRAAAENLITFPDMDPAHRQAFERAILDDSTQLSQHLESLAAEYRGRAVGHWPMTEIHSPDLLGCVARHIKEHYAIRIDLAGQPQWLKGDSHSLMQALIFLIERLVEHEHLDEITMAADMSQTRVYVELRWRGSAISNTHLNQWLTIPLPSLSGITVADALERHGCEPWSHTRKDGLAALRIPLQPSTQTQAQADEQALPPRPEFYDFDLMNAHSFTGEMGKRRLKDLSYVVFDTETTGLRPNAGDEIISVAAVRVTKGRVLNGETFSSLIHPGRGIPKDSIRFHGITDEMVKDQPKIKEVLPRFHTFVGDAVLVAHNAAFDMKFLKLKETQCGISFRNPVIDTLLLSLLIEGDNEDHSLDGICERLNLVIEKRHTALGDAVATAQVLVHFLDRLEAQGFHTFGQVMKASNMEAAIHFRAAQF